MHDDEDKAKIKNREKTKSRRTGKDRVEARLHRRITSRANILRSRIVKSPQTKQSEGNTAEESAAITSKAHRSVQEKKKKKHVRK